jgi:tetratricopeptide (TPR) repeat protein
MSDYQSNLAATYDNLGELYRVSGRFNDAEGAYKEAIALWKTMAEKHPEAADYQRNLANSHNNLGDVYKASGRAKEAEAAYKEAAAVRKKLAKEHPEALKNENSSD